MVAGDLDGRILPDEELVDINNNLVEYPIPVAGKFDTEFLEVPDEVLINAMREHQKYFSVVVSANRLMPCFIAVNNTAARDLSLSATGHQRVIRARLADAQFFYQGDLEVTNDQRVEKLKKVLFQAELGTVFEKSERTAAIAEALAASIEKDDDLKAQVVRAARLSKSDLVSQVVGEFPKLQGVMGRIYAGLAGEPGVGIDDEVDVRGDQAVGECPPLVGPQQQAEVGHRHVVAVDRVGRPFGTPLDEVGDDLMAEQVEVDPVVGRAALWAPERLAVEPSRRDQVVDRERQVESGPLAHSCAVSQHRGGQRGSGIA